MSVAAPRPCPAAPRRGRRATSAPRIRGATGESCSEPPELDAEVAPYRVHPGLRRVVHDDFVGPLPREPFFLPFASPADPHLRSVREPTTQVSEHLDRSQR